jgi:hypothetical protein
MTTITPERQKVVDRVEADLVSGRTFQLTANSNNSVRKGGAPIASRHFGQIVATLGKFAADSDWATAAVLPILRRINPYLMPNEVVAQVAQGLAEFTREPYRDVIGATGPEAGRPSAHLHPNTLRKGITLSLLMTEVELSAGYIGHVPGIGWCVAALMEREGMTVPAHLFPKTAAKAA